MTGTERIKRGDAIIEQLIKIMVENNLSYKEARDILENTIRCIGYTKLVFGE